MVHFLSLVSIQFLKCLLSTHCVKSTVFAALGNAKIQFQTISWSRYTQIPLTLIKSDWEVYSI